MNIMFFNSPAEWRQWLEENHDKAQEIQVGYYKVSTGKPSMTWAQSVDEALCFGWIDGIRKSVDADSYTIRFTPRRPRSNWSAVNLKRIRELIAEGRVHPAGLQVFESRDEKKTTQYSYENRPQEFEEPYAQQFKKHEKAWYYFQAQAPSYRRAAIWWVISAKQEKTRLSRLAQLIEDSEKEQPIAHLDRRPKSK